MTSKNHTAPVTTTKNSAQRVFITGCSTGIGRAFTKAFIDAGFHVIATARRIDSISDLTDEYSTQKVTVLPLDVNDHDAIQNAVATAGQIDILINNAGYGAMGAMLDIAPDKLQQQFATNTFAPIALSQTVAPQMIARGSGKIVNIGSISGILTTPFSGAYCASKAALHSLSDALRIELAPFGLDVISIQPGAIASEMGNNAASHAAESLPSDSFYSRIADAITARAHASQENATPASDFAAEMVKAITKKEPPAVIRYGNKSGWMPRLALLPAKVTDRMLSKRFQLDKLQG